MRAASEWRVTVSYQDDYRYRNVFAPEPEPPRPPGQVLSERYKDRQWQMLVRGTSDDHLAALRAHGSVSEFECRSPTLEEIFVAYMNAKDPDPIPGSVLS